MLITPFPAPAPVQAPAQVTVQAPAATEAKAPVITAAPLSSMLVVPQIKTVVAAKKQASAVKTLASRGGSPMMRAGARGGSPRDYARYMAQRQKNSFGQRLANQALTYRGRPYIMGAASPSRGFDCSGLVYYLLRQRGYNPPRTAAGMARWGVPVPRYDLKAGDLIFFANTYKRGISHIGIYMGNNKFVHAANKSRGVTTSSLAEAYYARKYAGARRVAVK